MPIPSRFACALIIVGCVASSTHAQPCPDAATKGCLGPVQRINVPGFTAPTWPVHALALRNNKVLILDQWGTNVPPPHTPNRCDIVLVDPFTDPPTITAIHDEWWDGYHAFCSGHASTSTGDFWFVGGGNVCGDPAQRRLGSLGGRRVQERQLPPLGPALVPDLQPPYFYGPDRPVISDPAPGVICYGRGYTVSTPQAASITKVRLIRLGAATHSFDQDTRSLELNFLVTGGNTIRVAAPGNGNEAPPGYYNLFIATGTNGDLPSLGRIVQLLPITSAGL